MVKGLEVEQRRQQVVQGLLAHKTLRQIHAELVGDTERTVRCSLATGGRDALAMRQEWAAVRTGTVHELVAEELGNVGHLYTNVFCHAFADAWPASGGQEGDLMRLADAQPAWCQYCGRAGARGAPAAHAEGSAMTVVRCAERVSVSTVRMSRSRRLWCVAAGRTRVRRGITVHRVGRPGVRRPAPGEAPVAPPRARGGVRPSVVGRLELATHNPSIEALQRLSHALGLRIALKAVPPGRRPECLVSATAAE